MFCENGNSHASTHDHPPHHDFVLPNCCVDVKSSVFRKALDPCPKRDAESDIVEFGGRRGDLALHRGRKEASSHDAVSV